MQAGNLYLVASLKTTQFIGALATGVGEYADIQLPESIGAGRVARCYVRAITIVSTENLDWEVWVLSRTGGTTADADTDPTRGYWSFVAADGKRVAGAGLYHYYNGDLEIPYQDEDQGAGAAGTKAYLHTCLVNRAVGAKSAGAPGYLSVRFFLEPSYTF